MNVHFLQHVPFEGLGSIETWLDDRQAEITSTRFFLNEHLPDIRELGFHHCRTRSDEREPRIRIALA